MPPQVALAAEAVETAAVRRRAVAEAVPEVGVEPPVVHVEVRAPAAVAGGNSVLSALTALLFFIFAVLGARRLLGFWPRY